MKKDQFEKFRKAKQKIFMEVEGAREIAIGLRGEAFGQRPNTLLSPSPRTTVNPCPRRKEKNVRGSVYAVWQDYGGSVRAVE